MATIVDEHGPTQLGMAPAASRRRGQGMHIGYTVVDCWLGRLLVAGTERGVSALSLGDSDELLEAALFDEYPEAEIQPDNFALADWVGSLTCHLDGGQPHLALPLDVRATAFQWRVWEELQSIPYGSTRTYREIARAIGSPSAARAVGHACAINRVSVVIPCHRAVREDGGLGGYRWGLERKRALLEQERATGNG